MAFWDSSIRKRLLWLKGPLSGMCSRLLATMSRQEEGSSLHRPRSDRLRESGRAVAGKASRYATSESELQGDPCECECPQGDTTSLWISGMQYGTQGDQSVRGILARAEKECWVPSQYTEGRRGRTIASLRPGCLFYIASSCLQTNKQTNKKSETLGRLR